MSSLSIRQHGAEADASHIHGDTNASPQQAPAMPPAMAEVKQLSADELLKEMNRVPLFMTTLDETDGDGGENIGLEALKALAYEGTRADVAGNFREQGNELARVKQWSDAKEFYDKALAALRGPQMYNPNPDVEVVEELDEEAERKKELEIEEACYTNRALCNLEKSENPLGELLNPSIASLTPVLCVTRKLSLVYARLCLGPSPQSKQRQSLVPLRICVPGAGQDG